MSTTEAPRGLDPDPDPEPLPRHVDGDLRLDPLRHGRGRVPGRRTPTFDLAAFAAALERGDVEEQLSRYAPDADIRVVDPDGPPPVARTVRGRAAVRAWLAGTVPLHAEVIHLVNGGDRIAFTERRRSRDGSFVVATSTAELRDELISTQHTILARTRPPADGWTRVGRDLWTATS